MKRLVLQPLEKCACGASVGRRNNSDYWVCDKGHVTYRGPEASECTCSVPWTLSVGHAPDCAVYREPLYYPDCARSWWDSKGNIHFEYE